MKDHTEKAPKEFTLRAILLGMLLGLIFAIGNAYLGLKIGTTVSASIPAAVLSMAILRTFCKRVSILENNLVQTIASVGEGLAAGVIFTVPALFFLGERLSAWRIFTLASLGGILGVLFMIPMRRYIIVHEHKRLPFPEGTACAQILQAGASSQRMAFFAFLGIIVGAIHKCCSSAFQLLKETPKWALPFFQKTEFSMDCTAALLGVGFIVGPRITSLLLWGGALGWWILIPLIQLFGANNQTIVFPATIPIAQMSAEQLWANYIRYIGAGAVAIGGLISLVKIAPIIRKTFSVGLTELFQKNLKKNVPRIDRDISLRWLVIGSLAIIITLWLLPGSSMNAATIVLLAVLGFFFVAVTSLTVGIVGSTSNPVSGMTLTTLLLTCIIFVAIGWTERIYLISALTMSVVVNIAIALAGTTSQDLKTGFLLGATPRLQQIAEILGVFLPALAIGTTLHLLDQAYGLGSSLLPAPQGTMMALIAKGVIQGNIPITLILVGVILGLSMELLRLPVLPFALGLYLPLSLSTAMMLGGIVSFLVKKKERATHMTTASEKGILAASGLVAGDACTGVIIALLTVLGIIPATEQAFFSNTISLSVFLALAAGLGAICFYRRNSHP